MSRKRLTRSEQKTYPDGLVRIQGTKRTIAITLPLDEIRRIDVNMATHRLEKISGTTGRKPLPKKFLTWRQREKSS